MHVRAFEHAGVDLFEEVEKLDRAVALVALFDHGSCCNIQRRKQRRRAMADIGMGPALRHAVRQRKIRFNPLQSSFAKPKLI